MKIARALVFSIVVILLVAACAKTSYPVSIKTPFSELQITGIQLVSSYPEGCDIYFDDDCFQAEPGEKVLMIWIVPSGEYEPGLIRNGIFDNCQSAILQFSGGDDLSAAMGGRAPDGRFYLQYFVPDGTNAFRMTWFDNSRIKLTQ